jgi:hypothetical protein
MRFRRSSGAPQYFEVSHVSTIRHPRRLSIVDQSYTATSEGLAQLTVPRQQLSNPKSYLTILNMSVEQSKEVS